MDLIVGYENARHAAYAVLEELKGRGFEKISARPWNKFDPDNTSWWVVPSTEWPAYKHGKLFFSPNRAPENSLFCGLHVEKGIDAKVESAYSSFQGKRLIMKDDWCWLDFIKGLQNTTISRVISEVSEMLVSSLLLRIEAGFVADPQSFDPHATRFDWDLLIFETSGTSLELIDSKTPANLLIELKKSLSLRRLADDIPEIPQIGWVWIDFFIGNIFEIRTDSLDQDLWDASRIWREILSNWESFFR